MLSIHTKDILRKGFTLIELLVVMAILGVLVTITLAKIDPFGQISKARDAQRKSDLKNIQTALELYSQDHNDLYPGTLAPLTGPYITTLPKDPSSGSDYAYTQVSGGTGYRLYTSVNKIDPQACNRTNTACPNVGAEVCSSVCNYGVTSTNLTP